MDKTSEPNDQVEKFKALTRELVCDEDDAAFDERLKKMAKAPPLPTEKRE